MPYLHNQWMGSIHIQYIAWWGGSPLQIEFRWPWPFFKVITELVLFLIKGFTVLSPEIIDRSFLYFIIHVFILSHKQLDINGDWHNYNMHEPHYQGHHRTWSLGGQWGTFLFVKKPLVYIIMGLEMKKNRSPFSFRHYN